MAFKKYSDAFKNEAVIKLICNQYDYDLTAKQVGCSGQSLRNWEQNFHKDGGMRGLLERATHHLLVNIPGNMPGKEWGITVGILLDKWLLVRGEPTSRSGDVLGAMMGLTDEDWKEVEREMELILTEENSSDVA